MKLTSELLSPDNADHVRRYWQLVQDARGGSAIEFGLPEIFETDATEKLVKEKLRVRTRYMIIEGGYDIGRIELTEHLNANLSVIRKVPKGVTLGMNACYFVLENMPRNNGPDNPQLDLLHKEAAMLTIELAFARQTEPDACPWLPVSPSGDPSRGWLQLQNEADLPYVVSVGKPITGWFPEFGIDNQSFSIAIAKRK